jgi:hypothetical protein
MEKVKFAKVKDHDDIIRDMKSKALISIDKIGLESYKRKKNEQMKINAAVEELNTMKQEITELKVLMHCILEKLG